MLSRRMLKMGRFLVGLGRSRFSQLVLQAQGGDAIPRLAGWTIERFVAVSSTLAVGWTIERFVAVSSTLAVELPPRLL